MQSLVLVSLLLLTVLSKMTPTSGQLVANTSGQRQTAEQCQSQCQGLYKFYKTIFPVPSMLTRFLDSCLQLCPVSNSAATTTTVRPTTTSASTTRSTSTLECGISGSRDRVVGGSKANECELPWVVEVVSPCVNCGGTIVDKRHIVTAAHCLNQLATGCRVTAADLTVRVGSSSLMNTTAYKVTNIEIDMRFNYDTKDYDTAVLTLAQDLNFTQCVRPICIPQESDDPAKADECLVAGWGKTFELSTDRVHINDLMKARVPIVSMSACQSSYQGYTVTINELKVCAGNYTYGGVDSCKGDSGGPLMCYQRGRYYFYGIVSFGLGCALPRFPGVYTKVNNPEVAKFINAATVL